MRLNPHLHTIALDGAWYEQGSELVARGQAAGSRPACLHRDSTRFTTRGCSRRQASRQLWTRCSQQPLPRRIRASCWKPRPWRRVQTPDGRALHAEAVQRHPPDLRRPAVQADPEA